GTFCVKYPDISNAIVGKKTQNIRESGADPLLAGDLGCLMNMAGKLQREGSGMKVRHVAEVLAGMDDTPPIGGGRRRDDRSSRTSHGACHPHSDRFAATSPPPRGRGRASSLRPPFPLPRAGGEVVREANRSGGAVQREREAVLMQITSPAFKQNSRGALADAQLQKALGNVRAGF